MSTPRDEFSQSVKAALAGRVNSRCSNPDCRAQTMGPREDPGGVLNVGFAAHITAAAEGGPRYDVNLTRVERSSHENGIWLCGTCAKLIDSDTSRFTAALLREWKRQAEELARRDQGKPADDPQMMAELRRISAAVAGPLHIRAPKVVAELRQEFERANPTLTVTSISFPDAATTKVSLDVKRGTNEVIGGTLTFPDSPEGRRGQEKLSRALDYGTKATLESDEVFVTTNVTIPGPPLPGQAQVTIGPAGTQRTWNVRIEATRGGQTAVIIPFTTVTVVRTGRREVELEIARGLFAATWSITLAKNGTGSGEMSLTLDLESQPPQTALDTIRFVRALVAGDRITAVPLDNTGVRIPIAESGLAFDPELLDIQEEALRHLMTINDEFHETFRYPDVLDDAFLLAAWTLATAISHGKVVFVPEQAVHGELSREEADIVAAKWRNGESVSIGRDDAETYSLLGRELTVGPVKSVYLGVTPLDPEWEKQATGAPVKIQVNRIDRYYARWIMRRRDHA